MKKLLIVLILFSISLSAQIDKKKQVFNLQLSNPFESNTSTNSSSSLPSLQYKSVLDKDDNYLKKYSVLNNTSTSKSILEDNKDFKNPGDELKDNLNKKLHDKPIDESFKSNQFLGQFSTKAKYIKIVCRDHEYPDGDRVRILVNDVVFIPEILLEAASKEYYLDLSKGFNKIEFLALNQGSSGPNTAAFRVYDDKGNLITSNEWNLTTGVLAKIVVVQDDSPTLEEDKKE
ncbi:conserved exported hypothetical protein [Flavobacterium sp. 9AF]|uniref:hypothetical protein n=1 Tax=Flavobacterium sp. 9AF TaxID=2653142 RepID=UPI0012EFE8CD|nr:hypothetical protein [Flavobacterium sp. 9AF]VXB71086.1 conserved exported hypothetical protein [Flavobacterium sp. 9AF]